MKKLVHNPLRLIPLLILGTSCAAGCKSESAKQLGLHSQERVAVGSEFTIGVEVTQKKTDLSCYYDYKRQCSPHSTLSHPTTVISASVTPAGLAELVEVEGQISSFNVSTRPTVRLRALKKGKATVRIEAESDGEPFTGRQRIEIIEPPIAPPLVTCKAHHQLPLPGSRAPDGAPLETIDELVILDEGAEVKIAWNPRDDRGNRVAASEPIVEVVPPSLFDEREELPAGEVVVSNRKGKVTSEIISASEIDGWTFLPLQHYEFTGLGSTGYWGPARRADWRVRLAAFPTSRGRPVCKRSGHQIAADLEVEILTPEVCRTLGYSKSEIERLTYGTCRLKTTVGDQEQTIEIEYARRSDSP